MLNPALSDASHLQQMATLACLARVSQRDLKRFVRRSCTTAEAAEGAMPLGLRHLREKIGTRRTAKAVSHWLIQSLEGACLKLVHVSRPTPPLDAFLVEELPFKPASDDLRAQVASAILALPPVYRTVLILRDVEETPAPQAAAQLGISLEAFNSRLHRARRMLREALTGSGYWFGAIR